jgi:hypothetical protein
MFLRSRNRESEKVCAEEAAERPKKQSVDLYFLFPRYNTVFVLFTAISKDSMHRGVFRGVRRLSTNGIVSNLVNCVVSLAAFLADCVGDALEACPRRPPAEHCTMASVQQRVYQYSLIDM